jgi:hypothetical protein
MLLGRSCGGPNISLGKWADVRDPLRLLIRYLATMFRGL